MIDEPGGNEGAGGTARGVGLIVVVGLVLGLGFNTMLLAAGPKQGLAWIRHETKLKSLEDTPGLSPDPVTAPSVTEPAPALESSSESAPESAPESSPMTAMRKTAKQATKPGARPAHADTAHTATAAHTLAPAMTHAPATTEAPAPHVALPVIPVTREPLEAQYATVKKFWDADSALFVDARSAEEYAEAHIPGALNLPFDDVFKDPDLAGKINAHGRVIITYCGGGDCELSKSLASSFIDAGNKRVLVFMGGLPGWKEPGNPVATGATPGRAAK